jgi:BCD family chlorophyll transporter-like MFS transporter
MTRPATSLLRIARFGVVQASIGAVVVFAISTLNRIMVVELGLPAIVPGLLVALHYAVQILRPRLGHGSDRGGRRTPWIVGGMAALAAGGVLAAAATALMASQPVAGIAMAVLAYGLIGLGVGASGTSLLVLLADQVEAERRAPAATIVWIMMIAGFIITAGLAGRLLDPFSPPRLVAVALAISGTALLLTLLATRRLERPRAALRPIETEATEEGFGPALRGVWAEPAARRFTIFVFLSMLAYSAQELILEPFAGLVFQLSPGASARMAGVQHSGLFLGMIAVAWLGSRGGARAGSMRGWTIGGCSVSALAVAGLAAAGLAGSVSGFTATVLLLGIANGVFTVAAIGAMMQLSGAGRPARQGIRMGLWGAAQALAFALGGLLGTSASDLARSVTGSPLTAYAWVFLFESLLFCLAAAVAARAFPAAAAARGAPVAIARRTGLAHANPE